MNPRRLPPTKPLRSLTIEVPGRAPVVVEAPIRRWWCSECKLGINGDHVTQELRPHAPMHQCAKLGGMSVPLLPLGTKARRYAVEREDYVGNEVVQRDDEGRVIQSVVTEREDGSDVAVYAPTATGGVRDG